MSLRVTTTRWISPLLSTTRLIFPAGGKIYRQYNDEDDCHPPDDHPHYETEVVGCGATTRCFRGRGAVGGRSTG